MARISQVKRSTSETQIEVSLNLDGTGIQDIQTPVPFLDHMLSQVARHGYFDLTVKAKGDTHIDFHHTVEDVGIAVGQAFKEAFKMGSCHRIRVYGQHWRMVSRNTALAIFRRSKNFCSVLFLLAERTCLP